MMAPASFSATVVLSRPMALGASLTLVTVRLKPCTVLKPPASVLVMFRLTLGSVSKSRL